MQVLIRRADEIITEDAHGGAGRRKLYIDEKKTPSQRVQGMTQGWMPAHGHYDWHQHEGIEEVMYVIDGTGTVHDPDGEYPYGPGDVFVFPANVEHKIENPTDSENQFVFVRIYV